MAPRRRRRPPLPTTTIAVRSINTTAEAATVETLGRGRHKQPMLSVSLARSLQDCMDGSPIGARLTSLGDVVSDWTATRQRRRDDGTFADARATTYPIFTDSIFRRLAYGGIDSRVTRIATCLRRYLESTFRGTTENKPLWLTQKNPSRLLICILK